MNSPFFQQMLDALDCGVVILDGEGRIVFFNHWLELASGLSNDDLLGLKLIECFPSLDNSLFIRNFRSVLSFGNTAFFSNLANPWLIPLPAAPNTAAQFDQMQQTGQMGPLREDGEIRFIYLLIRDITESVGHVQQLTDLAMHDNLTGCWNRRWFDHWLVEETERASRYQREMSLIMFDLDQFKQINDTQGHPIGDKVLAEVARVCAGVIRTTDTLARYGGDEFCVLLPETNLMAAIALAERLRAGVAGLVIVEGEVKLKITSSLGVAEFSANLDPEAFLQMADEALYRAKKAGRNRVAAAQAH